ncbi:MAG: type II secretion system GspH family protein [Candidatus Nomurabacteria bacterium]|jgi:prepilin-type N-terminal cleavage/methylation domain-containing protein|nr:type II secretion system GspH family protein [Candidatus Nomurabacteria bacterium]
MKQRQLSTKKGFTIIEVVLVLAIAGLIFLMVFLALPALQRSQRDTQRKNDMSRVQAAINSYQANNRGALPTAWGSKTTGFVKDYLFTNGDAFQDPDGSDYTLTDVAAVGSYSKPANFDHKVYMVRNAKCEGETPKASTGSGKVAIVFKLEGGGIYCLNN